MYSNIGSEPNSFLVLKVTVIFNDGTILYSCVSIRPLEACLKTTHEEENSRTQTIGSPISFASVR